MKIQEDYALDTLEIEGVFGYIVVSKARRNKGWMATRFVAETGVVSGP
jgi:hypothetical protein